MLIAPPAAAEATLVVEADSGKVLFADHATYPWYPASTSKLMTMYLTLRAVKEHRINMDTLLTVSPNAVAQAPSKMGFAAGTQVTVDNALKMMMVKSANDMAVVLAEGVGGSIEKFADEMNATSRRLGMTQSSWVNPNGLPADEQITSARDMAILARAILKELPEYESYWHIPSIKFGRRIMRNTNGLIGRYPDADGMKTGFICASGFNVVATATRGGRKLIVVVYGARSGAARSEKAAQLFERGFASGGLSWLMPSLGTVDALQPIAAAPVNMKDEVCGKHRKRPASDDEETGEGTQANSTDVDQSSAFAMTSNSLGAKAIKGPLLGDLQPSVPVIVYTGPQRSDGGAALDVASAPKRKRPGIAIAKGADGKPKTTNAAAGFAPAAAESKTVAPPSDAAAKTKAKKKAAKKSDAKTADTKSADTKSADTKSADTKSGKTTKQ
ncbi:MAG: D-alanyl-D-alanine carboxypeptidase [Alphaproteobacteria bacterium]|nr:D-alanyl-D-alanine carboxypeptidase [Alphaproteobacteria bacterium]